MRFGITANVDVPDAMNICNRVLKALEGHEVFLETGLAKKLGMKGKHVHEMDVDVLITIGGDGTILRSLQRNQAPIFGINAGVLGFLTEIPAKDIDTGIQRVIRGDYVIDERLKLKTTVGGKRLYDSVNETVVHTANIAKIRQFQVHVDDQMVMDVRADGIIVATPTGSTCYAMSVGAPIIDPRVDAVVIAPMAPFKFAAKPIVVPATSNIKLKLERPKPCVVVVDGQEMHKMSGNEMVELTVSENRGRFISFGRDFYARLRDKLMGSL
ncbi:MAG: NAD(+)/NADH kinase [Methanomassiliicoccales archaeon]|nr:NAD(+)/NADH kinase [Methanomassiliicoccales archaeon]